MQTTYAKKILFYRHVCYEAVLKILILYFNMMETTSFHHLTQQKDENNVLRQVIFERFSLKANNFLSTN